MKEGRALSYCGCDLYFLPFKVWFSTFRGKRTKQHDHLHIRKPIVYFYLVVMKKRRKRQRSKLPPREAAELEPCTQNEGEKNPAKLK